MNKIYAILFLFTINFATIAQPDSLLATFNYANNLYENNDYIAAINSYEQILSSGYESDVLYYNLGNAYLKNNNIPKAILYYEKSLKLNPNDKDIIYNIEFSNLYVKDQFTPVPDFIIDRIYSQIVHLADSNTWAIISISFFILTWVSFMTFLFSKIIIRRKLAFFGAILLLFFSITTFIFSSDMKSYIEDPNTAIIMNISTLKSSPQSDGTDLFIINPGVKLKIENKNDDWYEVKLPNGVKGWVRQDVVELI